MADLGSCLINMRRKIYPRAASDKFFQNSGFPSDCSESSFAWHTLTALDWAHTFKSWEPGSIVVDIIMKDARFFAGLLNITLEHLTNQNEILLLFIVFF